MITRKLLSENGSKRFKRMPDSKVEYDRNILTNFDFCRCLRRARGRCRACWWSSPSTGRTPASTRKLSGPNCAIFESTYLIMNLTFRHICKDILLHVFRFFESTILIMNPIFRHMCNVYVYSKMYYCCISLLCWKTVFSSFLMYA